MEPSNSEYRKFYNDFDPWAKARGFYIEEYPWREGLTCFFATSDDSKHGTPVLNKIEAAEMYVNLKRAVGNGPLSRAMFEREYTPSKDNEDFLDKVAIVGFCTFFNVYNS